LRSGAFGLPATVSGATLEVFEIVLHVGRCVLGLAVQLMGIGGQVVVLFLAVLVGDVASS
jgi:hypothetical protein